MHKLFHCVLSGWLLTFQPTQAVEFTYFLASGTRIEAPESAVDDMIIGADATITIGADGAITGDGTMTFRLMQPCRWFPPEPVDAFNCRIDGVSDGAFTVSGQVVEWIHRHDDDNPLKDAIFEYADARASERPDYAPYRIRLQLTPTALPTEHLTFWGFSNGGTQSRSTGAATIGMHVSSLFDGPFELLAVPLLARVRVPENARTFIYEGNYEVARRCALLAISISTKSPASRRPTPMSICSTGWKAPHRAPSRRRSFRPWPRRRRAPSSSTTRAPRRCLSI